MKTAIRCLVCIILMGFAWVTAIEVAYGVPNPSTKRIMVGMLISMGSLCLSVYVSEPTMINKRIYAILVCISAYRRIRYFFRCETGREKSRENKVYALKRFTGCRSYGELYRWAQKEYLRR